ncbi:MAG: threonine aldolase [Hellea sp.]|nr:threonine aldolase [Hellea sp.]
MTYSFRDDYSEGCHPEILAALSDANLVQQDPYGDDEFSAAARELICARLGQTSAVHFVASGTMANLLIISSVLKPFEAVISVQGGHIAEHEAGAIERAGHKVIIAPGEHGKLRPEDIRNAVAENTMPPHMARPKLVYISNATETGLAYRKSELKALRVACDTLGLWLMMDGARLGAAMVSKASDLTWPDLAKLTDIFWIGGTKAGALLGEAIVFNKGELAEDFAFHIKQRGAMISKGRVLGLQFKTLFEKDLFDSGALHAHAQAKILSDAMIAAGYKLSCPTETNQLFPILPLALVEKLERDFAFHRWGAVGTDHMEIRLVTSWATDPDQVARFVSALG